MSPIITPKDRIYYKQITMVFKSINDLTPQSPEIRESCSLNAFRSNYLQDYFNNV